MPTAMIALIEVCSSTLSRFETVRKCGVRIQSRPRPAATSRAGCRAGVAAASQAEPHATCPAQRPAPAPAWRSRFELGHDPALAHHEDAVAHAEDLRQLGGDHEDGRALRGQPVHELVDLDLGADVDAPRRLVEDEHVRVGRATCRGRPSAGCRRRAARPAPGEWACDSEVVDVASRRRTSRGRPVHEARRERRGTLGRARFRSTERPSTRPWVLRSSGRRPTPRRMASLGRADARPLPRASRPPSGVDARDARGRARFGRPPGGRQPPPPRRGEGRRLTSLRLRPRGGPRPAAAVPRLDPRRGKCSVRSRPTIIVTSSGMPPSPRREWRRACRRAAP